MADQKEEKAPLNITDRDSAFTWLKTQPKAVCVAIAARAALRGLPLVQTFFSVMPHAAALEPLKTILLPVFHANAISWLAADVPSQEMDPALAADAAAAAAAAALAADAADAALAALAADAAAATDAALAARAARAATLAADAAAATDAALAAADAALAALAAAADALMWQQFNKDATLMASEDMDGAKLALAPLWHDEIPARIEHHWSRLRTALIDINEDWQVWTDWYEARLKGGWTHQEVSNDANRAIELERIRAAHERRGEEPAIINQALIKIIERHGAKIPASAATPPDKTAAIPRRENVRTHLDDPAIADLLNRQPFAQAIVEKMNEVHAAGGKDGFAVHLHGPWGTGKTSILNFMKTHLAGDKVPDGQRWIVIEFNAWEHEHINPPWWPLIVTVKNGTKKALNEWRHAPPWCYDELKGVWYQWKIINKWLYYIIAGVFAAIFALIAFSIDGPWADRLKALATISGLIALFGKKTVAILKPDENAALVKRLTADSMKPFADLFKKLTSVTQRPVVIFIDDLDRCKSDYVVDLLEGIQTLFRQRNVAYVVAADRKWISTSFEVHYADFAEPLHQTGRPLGYLFLEKIFQVSTSVPGLGDTIRADYLEELTAQKGTGTGADADKDESDDAQTQHFIDDVEHERDKLTKELGDDLTQESIEQYIQRVGERPAVLGAASLELASSKSARIESEHILMKYADAMPKNPRGMKRMINAFGLRRAINMLEGIRLSTDILARWTIIEQRWPELADELVRQPNLLETLSHEHTGDELEELSENIRGYANNPAIRAAINDKGSKNQVLTAEHIRTIAGL